jgi:hypothetical protein
MKLARSYQEPPAPARGGGVDAREPRDIPRPPTLTATVVVSSLSAFCLLAGAVISYLDGKALLLSAAGLTQADASSPLVSSTLDSNLNTLKARATLAIVVAVITVIFAILVRSGRTGIRICLTFALLLSAGVAVLNVHDSGVPGLLKGLGAAAILLALAAIVVTWLPANHWYAQERKALRRSHR